MRADNSIALRLMIQGTQALHTHHQLNRTLTETWTWFWWCWDNRVVYVWGYNGYCRLGLGDQKDVLIPKVVPQVSPLPLPSLNHLADQGAN